MLINPVNRKTLSHSHDKNGTFTAHGEDIMGLKLKIFCISSISNHDKKKIKIKLNKN